MSNINTLLSNLSSNDSGLRDKSAIELMDIGNPIAVKPLIEAIKEPNNINHRGTLVYALSNFDCSEHLSFLVNLVLTGNFEVSTGAFQIINDIKLNKKQIATIESSLDKSNELKEHNKEGFHELLKLIGQ